MAGHSLQARTCSAALRKVCSLADLSSSSAFVLRRDATTNWARQSSCQMSNLRRHDAFESTPRQENQGKAKPYRHARNLATVNNGASMIDTRNYRPIQKALRQSFSRQMATTNSSRDRKSNTAASSSQHVQNQQQDDENATKGCREPHQHLQAANNGQEDHEIPGSDKKPGIADGTGQRSSASRAGATPPTITPGWAATGNPMPLSTIIARRLRPSITKSKELATVVLFEAGKAARSGGRVLSRQGRDKGAVALAYLENKMGQTRLGSQAIKAKHKAEGALQNTRLTLVECRQLFAQKSKQEIFQLAMKWLRKFISERFSVAKEEGLSYGRGIKALWRDIVSTAWILAHAPAGLELKDRHRSHILKTFLDMCKLVPMLAVVSLPGGSLLVPIITKILPSTLPTAIRRELDPKYAKEHRDQLATNLATPSVEQSPSERGASQEVHAGLRSAFESLIEEHNSIFFRDMKRVAAVVNASKRLAAGPFGCPDTVKDCSEALADDSWLHLLPRRALKAMAQQLDIHVWGIAPKMYIRFQVTRRLKLITSDDEVLQQYGGPDELADPDLESACKLRGMILLTPSQRDHGDLNATLKKNGSTKNTGSTGIHTTGSGPLHFPSSNRFNGMEPLWTVHEDSAPWQSRNALSSWYLLRKQGVPASVLIYTASCT